MTVFHARRSRVSALVIASAIVVLGTATIAAAPMTTAGPENPLLAYATGGRTHFEGRVVERLDAGSYVYLAVERADGSRAWVATLASSRGAALGVTAVSVIALGHADHFDSRRLGRSFDDLYFAVVRPA